MRMRFGLVATIGVAPLVTGSAALADDWISAEAPAALAVSDAQEGLFRSGAMPAGGMYHGHGAVAFGFRMRAGVLRNGPEPMNHLKDPSTGGLVSAGGAVRLQLGGLWIEGVIGPGLTGRELVPAAEAGVGFNVRVGPIEVGPSLRYLRLENHEEGASVGSAGILLVGIEAQFGRHSRHEQPREEHRPEEPTAPIVKAPPPPPSPPLQLDRDRDDVADVDDGCIDDGTGCVSVSTEIAKAVENGTIEISDDRIVLDERVLFDVNRARVRSAGREMIGAIARMWRTHPEWQHITVEGHADMRGPDDYNAKLSQRRAALARAALVHHGFRDDRVDAIGYGRARPRDLGTSEESHHRNRRVEFVIVRHAATEPEAAPADASLATAPAGPAHDDRQATTTTTTTKVTDHSLGRVRMMPQGSTLRPVRPRLAPTVPTGGAR